jgi:hypothetical protein
MRSHLIDFQTNQLLIHSHDMGLVKNALFIFTLRNASYGPGSPIHLASGQFRNHKSVKQL